MSEPNAGSDLAGLQTRAEVYDDHFVVNGQKVWTSYATIAQKCFCYVRTDPDAAEAQGHLAADHRHGHARHRHPAAAPHQRHRRLRRGVLHRRDRAPRRTSSASSTTGGRITQGSLAHERAGLWVESVGRLEQTVDGLVELAQQHGPRRRPDHPAQDRASVYELASSLRALGYKGFASFAQGSSAPEHSLHEDGDVGSRQGRVRARHGDLRAVRRRSPTPSARDEAGRWVHGFFMSFANTIAGGSSEIQRNIIAQRVLGPPAGLSAPMDFSLTDDQELLRDTARKLLERECPPALVRAHIDDPAAYDPLWRHLREYTALGAGPATDLCLFLEETGYVAAPGPFLATALFTSLTGEDDGTSPPGTVALPSTTR